MISLDSGTEPAIFYKIGDRFARCVIRLIVAKDGLNLNVVPCYILETGDICIDGASYSFDQIAAMFADGRLLVDLNDSSGTLNVQNLAWLQYSQAFSSADNEGFVTEICDAIRQLQGGRGMVAECREALKRMKANPTNENRLALERAYDAVPGHLRCWVGTLDTKDSEVRELVGERLGSEVEQ